MIDRSLARGHRGFVALKGEEAVGYYWWVDATSDAAETDQWTLGPGFRLGDGDAYGESLYLSDDHRGGGDGQQRPPEAVGGAQAALQAGVRAQADAPGRAHELPVGADRPIVVQRHHDWDGAVGALLQDAGRQILEMLHVHDIGTPCVEHASTVGLDQWVAVAVAKERQRRGTPVAQSRGDAAHNDALVDLLARGDLEAIRRRTREVINACAPTGRWALGSGNSFANYIPLEAYRAMLDEGRRTW